MTPESARIFQELRAKRGFDVEKYIREKTDAINKFFREEGLDSVVFGISGGVDSAVVYALFKKATEQDSPIKKIVPLFVPIQCEGTTGQLEGFLRAFNYIPELKTADATKAAESLNCSAQWPTNEWNVGQMASVLRTPVFYFHAAILQSMGYKSIVAGTTNRDEGGYIGYYGKASDMMCDLQPIADIHKSEVYQVARYLGVSEEIINSDPKGDVWDGRTDKEMIGATYDEIEFFTLASEYCDPTLEFEFKNLLKEDTELLGAWDNIIKLHNINAHKYKVGIPARFIDVLPRRVKGGWQ